MGRNRTTTRSPVPATVIQAGTPGTKTDPAIYQFRNTSNNPCYASPCLLWNGTSEDVEVKINNTTDFDGDADDDGPGHISVAANTYQDLSFGGQVRVQDIGLYLAVQAYAAIEIHGWINDGGEIDTSISWPN